MKRIYLICGVSESYKLLYHIGCELERSFKVCPVYVYFQENAKEYLVKRGVSPEKLRRLHGGLIYGCWEKKAVDLDYLTEMEKLYGIPNLWLIWDTMRNHEKNHTYYNALKLLESVFRHYEEFISGEKIDAVLTHVYPSTIPSYIFFNMLKEKGIKTYTFLSHRISGRFVVFNGYTDSGFVDKYEKVDEFFESIQKRDLSQEEWELADKIVCAFREKRDLNIKDKKIYERKSLSFKRFKNMLKELYLSYTLKLYRNLRWNSPLSPIIWTIKRLMTIPRRYLFLRSRLFESPDYNEKYVLCLLMKQPEASTIAKAPYYLDQIHFVHNLSKSLPVGYRLYVKPHYNDFGNHSYKYFKTMSQRPNIKMLSVYSNNHELVKNCSLVVTINGTVGWEGLLFEKPVITFGNVFFNSFPLVNRVTDTKQLPYMVKDLIRNYKPDKELLYKYIIANYKGSYEGTPIIPILDKKLSTDPQNIKKIATGLADAIGIK